MQTLKIKKYRLPILLCFAIEVITTLVRSKNVIIDVPISFTAFFAGVYLVIKNGKFTAAETLRAFSLTYLAINILAVIIDRQLPSVGAPNIVMSYLGMLCGYFFAIPNRFRLLETTLLVLCIVFSTWYLASGHNYWWHYLGYGTFTGKVATEAKPNWYLITENNDTVTEKNYGDKIVMFDFWQTKCFYCYAKMPRVEALYKKYNNDPRIIIQAINIPVDGDKPRTAFSLKNERNKYTIPSMAGDTALANKFGIEAYPCVVLMKHNKIFYKGDIMLATKTLSDLLDSK